MNNEKKIGIVGWKSGEMFGITTTYYNWCRQFGKVQVLSPRMVDDSIDLLVLPGGPDVSPHIYGQEPHMGNSNNDLLKEDFFLTTLPKYIELGIPVFGICLGMQQLNVHFGGTLTQEGDFEYSNPRTDAKEKLNYTDIIQKRVLNLLTFRDKPNLTGKVNTLHHQGVFPNNLAEPMKVIASSEQGNIEIMIHETLPIAGVQYHPEEIHDPTSTYIVRSLLKQSPKQNTNV